MTEVALMETELLLLQHLLDGDNFGVGYDQFHNKDINAAQFRSDDRGQLYRTKVVERAKEGGRLSELRFKVAVNPDETDREIKVVVNREGFIRSRQNGQPDLVDRFVGNLAVINEYEEMLTPLDTRIDEYLSDKDVAWGKDRTQIRMEVNRAFKKLVDDYFESTDYSEDERAVYEAIVANIGIKIAKLDLYSDDYNDFSDYNGSEINYLGRVREFFNDYLRIVEERAGIDFDHVAGHLHYVLTREDEYDSLIGLLEYVEGEYGL